MVPGESIDLSKLIGANCTLVVSHQQNMVGRTYASIDAVSKPTKRLVASGSYDPAMARQRIAEWKAKEAGQAQAQPAASVARPVNPVAAAFPQNGAAPAAVPKAPRRSRRPNRSSTRRSGSNSARPSPAPLREEGAGGGDDYEDIIP